MPFIIDRRSFLKQTLGAAACATLVRGWETQVRLALFSDTHIAADPENQYRGFFPHQNLKQAVAQASASNFDMLVVNGDLARLQGLVPDYAQFTSLIDPLADRLPVVVTLGNHDDRKNARSALIRRAGDIQAVEKKLVSVIDAGPFKLVLLDSLMATNVVAGQLGDSQREWLTQFLAAQGTKPVIVFVHHNPNSEDKGALLDTEQLLAILTPARQVKALVFGHTHVYAHETRHGLHLLNLPAVGYNFADGHPVGWIEGTFNAKGADLKLHAFAGETRDDGKVSSILWR